MIFDRFKETVGAVNNGLHGRGIQNDDLTAFRALFDEVDTADVAGVVVIGTGIGHQVIHFSDFGIETEHRDIGILQGIQTRGDAIAVNRVDEHGFDTAADHVFDLGDLFFIAVLGIQGDEGIAMSFNNFLDGAFKGDEERIGAIHAGITNEVTFSRDSRDDAGEQAESRQQNN